MRHHSPTMSRPSPDIAVVIPAWNAAPFLEATVASVLRQTYREFEIIIVDDGSTDITGPLADSLAMPGWVKVIHQANAGLSEARNAGAAAVRESVEFLLFLDADDLLEPGALGLLRECLSQNPGVVGAYGLPLGADARGRPRVTRMRDTFGWERLEIVGWRVRRLAVDAPTTFPCMAIWPCIQTAGQVLLRRTAMVDAGAWKTMPGEDWEMWLRLTALAPLARAPKVVLLKRNIPGSLSTNGKWLAQAEPMIRRSLMRPPYTPSQQRIARVAHAHSCLIKASWAAGEVRRGRVGSGLRNARRAGLSAARFVAIEAARVAAEL